MSVADVDPGMADVVAFAFVFVLTIQLPLAVIVYLDARRLGLERPEIWWFGIVAPAAGFLVAWYYVSQRANLAAEVNEPA